jgi:hypothetical protein
MKEFLNTYAEVLQNNHDLIGQVRFYIGASVASHIKTIAGPLFTHDLVRAPQRAVTVLLGPQPI